MARSLCFFYFVLNSVGGTRGFTWTDSGPTCRGQKSTSATESEWICCSERPAGTQLVSVQPQTSVFIRWIPLNVAFKFYHTDWAKLQEHKQYWLCDAVWNVHVLSGNQVREILQGVDKLELPTELGAEEEQVEQEEAEKEVDGWQREEEKRRWMKIMEHNSKEAKNISVCGLAQWGGRGGGGGLQPDEWLDDGDEGFDIPVGMNHVETFQVLP